MSDYNQDKLTEDVLAAFAGTPEPRLRTLMSALVKHIHAFAREVDLTPEEWLAGMKFLDATGQISTERRPEFILLSDTLGLSMMVVALSQARASGGATGATPATEATVEGPFYWPGAPDLALGSDIGEGVPGEPAARRAARPERRPQGKRQRLELVATATPGRADRRGWSTGGDPQTPPSRRNPPLAAVVEGDQGHRTCCGWWPGMSTDAEMAHLLAKSPKDGDQSRRLHSR